MSTTIAAPPPAPITDNGSGQQAEHLPGLLPHHLAELRASGLSDETIRATGILSQDNYVALATILNWRRLPKKLAPAIVFPYFDADGSRTGYCRIKPDRPRFYARKPVKYESPRGRSNEAYFPPGTLIDKLADKLADKAYELLITEGEKKTICAAQYGYLCLGLVGVFGWKDGKRECLLPALDRIAWKGRRVYLVFDSDAVDNPDVQDAESRLAAQLLNREAGVRVVRLPSGPDGKKVGLDDFLVAHGPAELRKLLDAAEEPQEPDAVQMKAPAGEIDAATEADAILSRLEQDGVFRLRFWRETFHLWQNGGYRELPDSEVRAQVVNYLNSYYFKLTSASVANVLDQLRAKSFLPSKTEPPAWLGEPPRAWKPLDVLATPTGLVHLPTLVEQGGDYLLSATPRYFTPAVLSYNFDIKAGPPVIWLGFLQSLWGDDQESIGTLQEWFGYCLLPDTSQQKILMIVGPKRSGKGTIARVLRALVGPANVCGPTLSSLAIRFGLWPLLNKTVAVVPDARLSGRTDSSIIVERLLSISGEDCLTIDRKMLKAVTGKLLTRMMLLSNELPRLGDASGALASRMILLRLTKSFFGREDRALTDKLLAELPSILLWAIEGWRRLRQRDHFVQPGASLGLLGELSDLSSPVGQFVRECCTVGADEEIPRADLYEAYADWARGNGRKHVEDTAGFGRAIRAVLPDIGDTKHRVLGQMTRFYQGVGLPTQMK